jgi:two-component system, NtrC family, sensor kinase
MTLPLYPIWLSDLLGSSLMIFFSFLCVRLASRLKGQDQNNVVWTYLFWFSYGLAAFAMSRSVGHIVKRMLSITNHYEWWYALEPYSGAINTLMLMVVASITLFFERIWKIYQQILKDKQALQEAHEKLLFLNRNLENLVTERTQDLALSERKYRRIFEVSRDMIAVVATDGTVIDLNPAGIEMLALPPSGDSSGIGHFSDFFHGAENWHGLEKALREQGYISDTEVALKRHDQSQFSALLSGTAEKQKDGEVNTFQFLIKDISQRKAMEKQLLQADKLASIGQLAAGVAHEISNPLSIILGYTQLLLRNEEQGTTQYADLKTIEKHARTCKTIVGDLLSFARSTKTVKEVVQLNDVIQGVINVVEHHLELDGIGIEKEFDAQVPALILDAEKIRQVFLNLIMNAKQAIGKKGIIRFLTQYDAERQRVLIQVEDSGCGIQPEHLPRIFDPFFTTKETGEGTGLGLSVSYGIVQNHGGEIFAESEPGKGSTFKVILPVPSEVAEKI